MKLIIAGGREQHMTDNDLLAVLAVFDHFKVQEVVSGKARGIDNEGEKIAGIAKIPVKPFPYLRQYGRRGGHLRNGQMAEYADALMIFPGNSGSASMLRQMLHKKKPIIVSNDTYDSYFWRLFPGVEELKLTIDQPQFKYFEYNRPKPSTKTFTWPLDNIHKI